MLYFNGCSTSSSVTVIARATANESITLTVAGYTPVAVLGDPAVDDGLVKLVVSGIPENTKVTYTLSSPTSGSGSGRNRTFPTSGDAKIITVGCQNDKHFSIASTIERLDPHLVCHLGDLGYIEDSSFPNKIDTQTAATFYTFRRLLLEQSPMVLYIMQNYPTIYMADDHDFGWNNAVDDLTVMNSNMGDQGRSYTYSSVADWELARDTAISTLKSYTMGNPACTWPSADADAAYFSVEIGNCEVFVPAQLCSTYDTGASATMRGVSGGVNPLLLGNQMPSFKLALQASTKTYKLIASQKANLYNRNVNQDSWGLGYTDWDGDYATTRLSLGPWIHDNTDTTFTVAGGVATVASDWHSPGVFRTQSGLTTQSYDHVSLIAGPTGRDEDIRNSNPLSTGLDNRDSVIFSLQDRTSNDAEILDPERRFYNCCGFIETNDTQMAMQLVTTQFSSIAGAAVSADSNKYAEVIYDMAIYGNELTGTSTGNLTNGRSRSIDVTAANNTIVPITGIWAFSALFTRGNSTGPSGSSITIGIYEATNTAGVWDWETETPLAVTDPILFDNSGITTKSGAISYTTTQSQIDTGKGLAIVINNSVAADASPDPDYTAFSLVSDNAAVVGESSTTMDSTTLISSTVWVNDATGSAQNYAGWGE
jgi:hypothetical protein